VATAANPAPVLSRWSIVLLVMLLGCLAAFRLRRAGQPMWRWFRRRTRCR